MPVAEVPAAPAPVKPAAAAPPAPAPKAEVKAAPTPAKSTPAPKEAAKPSTPEPEEIDTSSPEIQKLEEWRKSMDPKKPEPKEEGSDDAKAPDAAKPDDKATATPKDRPKEPKELRAEYDKVKAEAHTFKEELTKAQQKLQEAEAKGKDITVLTERVEKLQKDYDATQAELRAARQEVSPEFKAKFDKPFEQAIGSAQKSLQRILITDPTTGEQRKVDFTKDFVPFYRAAAMEDGSIDFQKLKEVFGEADIVAKQHLTTLLSLNDSREAALAEEKAQWKAKNEEAQANKILSEKKQAEEREAFQKLRQDAFKKVEEENAQWFGEVPEDEESNTKLKEGREFAATQPKTAQEAATLHAELYHRAAAFPRLTHQIEKLKEQLAERDSTIAEFRESKPGGSRRSSDAPTSETEDWADGLRKIAG